MAQNICNSTLKKKKKFNTQKRLEAGEMVTKMDERCTN